jgi:hypothetical protein
VLDGLFVTPAVTAITDALASARATDGIIVVVGHAKLAQALKEKRDVVAVGLSPRAAKKLGSTADTTAMDAKSVAAVIGIDIANNETWAATLGEWTRVVRDGGAVVLVDKGKPEETSRRALCAGLTEIEQRHAGSRIITSGLVTHFEE